MAEPCDPEVLHARVSVLENDNKRHDDDIKQLWKETSDLRLCAACLPAINSTLAKIGEQVQFLNECKIAQENLGKGRIGLWQENKWWVEKIFVMVMGAVVVVLWTSAMHLRIGVAP